MALEAAHLIVRGFGGCRNLDTGGSVAREAQGSSTFFDLHRGARSSAHAQLCNTGMMVMCHEMMCIMTDSVNHSSYAGITAGTPFPVETMLPRARARPHVDESPRASHLDVALALASVFFNANSATGRVAEWRNLQRHASRQGRGGVSIGSGPPMLSEVAREGSTWESRGSR